MEKEEIKSKIDFKNIQEFTDVKRLDNRKSDYLVDSEGNYIIYLSPLNVKLIERLLELEDRIKALEDKLKGV